MVTLRFVALMVLVPALVGLSAVLPAAQASGKGEPCVNYTRAHTDAKIGACKVATKVLQLITGGKTWTPDTYVEARCIKQPARRKLFCKITPASRGAAEDWEGTCWLLTYASRQPNKLTGVHITRYPRGSW